MMMMIISSLKSLHPLETRMEMKTIKEKKKNWKKKRNSETRHHLTKHTTKSFANFYIPTKRSKYCTKYQQQISGRHGFFFVDLRENIYFVNIFFYFRWFIYRKMSHRKWTVESTINNKTKQHESTDGVEQQGT